MTRPGYACRVTALVPRRSATSWGGSRCQSIEWRSLAAQRRERRETLGSPGSTPATAIPFLHQLEREIAKLGACIPLLRDDPVNLPSSLEETFGGARQRAGPLSMHREEFGDGDEAVAGGGEAKPELPIFAHPQVLVITAYRENRFAARRDRVVDEVSPQQLEEELLRVVGQWVRGILVGDR